MTGGSSPDNHLDLLMKAAQAGDAEAYAQLLNEITPRLRRFARSRRNFWQPEDIEDVVQDVLLSVHAVRATYDPERPFMPWLLAIARNRLADAARRYARGPAHEVGVENMAVTFAREPANTTVNAYDRSQPLEQAIAALPAMQREAIQLLKLREMPLKEAALISNTTAGALKAATHRAMAALRRALVKER